MLSVLVVAMTALPYVIAFGLALLVCLMAWASFVNPVAGVALMIATYVLTAMGAAAALKLGLFITLADLSLTLIAMVAIIRWITGRRPRYDPLVRAWLLLTLVWYVLFALGVAKYSTLAGVYFRDYFYLWASVTYLLTFELSQQQLRGSIQAMLMGGGAMVVLTLYRWVLLALGQPDSFWFEGKDSIRVITAGGAQMLALCFVVGVTAWSGLARKRGGWMAMAALLVPFLALLGHRSVWIAALAAVATAWWLARVSRTGRAAGTVLPVLAGLVLVVTVAALLPSADVSGRLSASVAEATQQKSTLAWRVDSWRELLTDFAGGGPAVWAAGRPFGSTMRRFIEAEGAETIATAHSHYISLLVRGGLVGLGAYLAAQLIALRRLLRQTNHEHDVSDHTLALLTVCCMVYAVPYGTDYLQGIVLGLAYSRASLLRPRARPPSAQEVGGAHRLRAYLP